MVGAAVRGGPNRQCNSQLSLSAADRKKERTNIHTYTYTGYKNTTTTKTFDSLHLFAQIANCEERTN